MVVKVDFGTVDLLGLRPGEYTDTGSRLQLRVRPGGSRAFSAQFWSTTEKRLLRWTLPTVRNRLMALESARERAAEAEKHHAVARLARERQEANRKEREQARQQDAEERKQKAEARKAQEVEKAKSKRTLAKECEAWLRREKGRLRPNTLRFYEAAFGKIDDDPVGKVAFEDLTRTQVVEFRDRMREKSGLNTANDAVAFASTVLNALVDRGSLRASPVAGMKRLKGEQKRQRWLRPAELHKVLVAADKEGFPIGHAVLLALHTLARVTEVIGAPWSEFDLKDKVWHLPASRNKSKRDFLMPLSDAAMDLLKTIRGGAGSSRWLFPSERHDGEPIATVQHGMARIIEAAGVEDWSFHDLRRTSRTLLSACGVRQEVAEACMNHAQPGLVGTYDLHDFAEEKRVAMTSLADRLAEIRMAKPKVAALEPKAMRPARK